MIVATASTCKTSSFFAGLMVRYSCSDIHGLLLELVSPPVACCDNQHLLEILQHACSVCAETAEHACSGISAQTEDAWSGFRRRSVCSEILQHACSVCAETAEHACSLISAQTEHAWSGLRRPYPHPHTHLQPHLFPHPPASIPPTETYRSTRALLAGGDGVADGDDEKGGGMGVCMGMGMGIGAATARPHVLARVLPLR
jgi:hypothetical protein